MCAKHTDCRSNKTKFVPLDRNSCSNPSISAVRPATVPTLDSDCSGESCPSGGSEDESEPVGEVTSRYTWRVLGMDCPSCASKIEKAVKTIDGVVTAKVVFSTEKLVIEGEDSLLASRVEHMIEQTGFDFMPEGTATTPHTSTGWKALVRQNAHILSIALAMLIAGIIKPFVPLLSEWLFIVTCLAGLWPIGKKALSLAKNGTPFAIETLMSVAALGALYLGETVEAAMVLLLFLIGEQLEAFAASKARSGVQALMALVPDNAIKILDEKRIQVLASELKPDDIIEVSPGGRLPADAILCSQTASFDESALTGESLPVDHHKGDSVMAGAVVVDRVVRLQVVSKQGENAIDRILHLIEEAESRKAPLERFLDKFSRWYTPLMMLVAALVIVTPPLLFAQPWETWVYRGLALLLIACPCALVISTPAAITSGLAAAAKRGALIKGGAALEQLGRIKTVAFDKTGTLTLGQPQVTSVDAFADLDKNRVLSIAAAIEVGSTHPLGISLVAHAKHQGVEIPDAHDKQALVGSGVRGLFNGVEYCLLSPSRVSFPLIERVGNRVEAIEKQGKTAVIMLRNQTQVVGVIAFEDTLREDAALAVESLTKLGVRSIMLTGDNALSAKSMGDKLGLDYKAGLLPEDKVRYVESLARTTYVAMVGDGINDAPAMKAAGIGIAMGGGTDVALETADAAITHNRLVELPAMIELSQATLLNIRQNVALALGLKGIFLVTSLFGITGLWVAVLADSGATALVTMNALRLLRFKVKS